MTLQLIYCAGVLASEPGQPLGPEDWVFNEPGMWAEMPLPLDENGSSHFVWDLDTGLNVYVFLSQGGALGWYIRPFQGQIRAMIIILIVMGLIQIMIMIIHLVLI